MSTFTIAIPCHNEAQNLEALLRCMNAGWNDACRPSKIVVFSSACADGTETIVTRFTKKSRIPIEMASEIERSGKCHAVNRLMRMSGNADIIVLVSADVMISFRDVMTLMGQFDTPTVGAAGGRPVPESPRRHMAFRVTRVMWEIHHLMATLAPKTTEVTAFRNLGFRLDESSPVDEAEIERQVKERGFGVVYCPKVSIRNAAPATLKDHMRQRLRVTRGHLKLWRNRSYCVGSLNPATRLRALRQYVVGHGQDRTAFYLMLLMELCVLAIALMQVSTRGRRMSGVWAPIRSAKYPIRP